MRQFRKTLTISAAAGAFKVVDANTCSGRQQDLPMTTPAAKVWDMLRLIRHGGPALCNIAVTNACNARCDFCNFANGKVPHKDLRWIDAGRFDAALDILHARGIRYVSFFGGEPLLHPRLPELIATAVAKGMGAAIITNGWLLSSKLDELAAAGLRTVYVSIDAPVMADHEANRGLKGLGARIRSATARMARPIISARNRTRYRAKALVFMSPL